MKKRMLSFGIFTTVLLQANLAFADVNGDVMSMLESMKQQMVKMQQTIDQQNLRIQQLESKTVLETPQAAAKIGPEGAQAYLTENDWQKGIKDNIGEAVPWLKGAKYGGDFRLRYEAFDFYDNNEEENTSSDRSRNRFRIRLRWGFEKDYGDDWKVGFRLATGTPSTSSGIATDNTSTNVTLGNPGYSVFKNIYVDRAYAQYSPNGFKEYGPIRGVLIGAGKFDNPFARYATSIVWDSDVTPEGAYEKANFQLVSTEENKLNAYLTMGQFIANENSGWETDANIYAYQGALNWSTYNFNTGRPVDFTGAVSFYDYTNWVQTVAGNTTGVSFLRTNTLAAGQFRVIDIYPELAFYVNRQPVTLWADYVQNIGIEGTDNALSSGNDIHDMDTAWGVGVKVGKAKKKGDWELFYGYYEIGANAVVAAFNDSDFGGPGGVGATNRQGHKFGLGYQLTDAIMVNWTGYVVTPLNPGPVVASSINETVFRSQLDAAYKF